VQGEAKGSPSRAMPPHLDRRLLLKPADYMDDAALFGTSGAEPAWRIPGGGDAVSLRVARVQHEVISAWDKGASRSPVSVIARRFGFSKQTLSKVRRGQRWAGTVVLAALSESLVQPTSRASQLDASPCSDRLGIGGVHISVAEYLPVDQAPEPTARPAEC